MMKTILTAIMLVATAALCQAQNNTTPANKTGATVHPTIQQTTDQNKNNMKVIQEERKKNFQAVKDLDTKEKSEVRAFTETAAAVRKRQQAEIQAAMEQLKNLRKKHQTELQDLAKQGKAMRDRQNYEKAALMRSLTPASARGQKTITPNSMTKPGK